LILSIWLHYSKVTKNHCRVWEFFPSVSASIGDYAPERNIWRCAIALGAGPRFISSILNYQLLQEALPEKKSLIKTALALDVTRIISAGLWTYISSTDYNEFHSVNYVLYMVLSFVWCGIHTPLFFKAKVENHTGELHYKRNVYSYKWKRNCLWVQFGMFAVSLYFFIYEHNMNCFAGAYSKYALCEWVLSAANILYDLSCYLDFQESYLTLEQEKKKT